MLLRFSVPVRPVRVCMTEKQETEYIREKPKTSHNEDEERLADFLRLDYALDSFKENGQTKCDEKNAIDECSQRLRPLPLYARHDNI